jgi:hypothetical protein
VPGWLKVLLAIVGLFIVTIVVIGVVAYKSFSAHEPELRAAAVKMRDEGKAFGTGKRPADCVEEALRRADRSFTGQIRTRVFADACLKAAGPSPEFCAQVPSGIIATAKWANTECIRRGLTGDQTCVGVYTAVGDYCHPR